KPLKDATAVNAIRWELFNRLKAIEENIEVGSGGRTKYNRMKMGLKKTHWLDAVCVGESTPQQVKVKSVTPLQMIAKGHGRRQRCGTDRHGFPIRHAPRRKYFMGFKTGDVVRADIPKGKYKGKHV